MYKQYALNYALTGLDADSMTTWDTGNVTVGFQVGEFDADGVPVGGIQGDGTQWFTLGTIALAQVDDPANTIFMYLGGDADFFPSAYIRFRFIDPTTNSKISNWIPIDFKKKPVAYFIMTDTTNSIGITCWIEGM